MYVYMADHFIVQQTLTQHCKAIFFSIKNQRRREKTLLKVDPVISKTHFWSRRSKKEEKKSLVGGSVVKQLPANAGDMSLIPDLGRSHMSRSI